MIFFFFFCLRVLAGAGAGVGVSIFFGCVSLSTFFWYLYYFEIQKCFIKIRFIEKKIVRYRIGVFFYQHKPFFSVDFPY